MTYSMDASLPIFYKKWMLDRGDAVQWGHGSFACVNLMLENPQADTL